MADKFFSMKTKELVADGSPGALAELERRGRTRTGEKQGAPASKKSARAPVPAPVPSPKKSSPKESSPTPPRSAAMEYEKKGIERVASRPLDPERLTAPLPRHPSPQLSFNPDTDGFLAESLPSSLRVFGRDSSGQLKSWSLVIGSSSYSMDGVSPFGKYIIWPARDGRVVTHDEALRSAIDGIPAALIMEPWSGPQPGYEEDYALATAPRTWVRVSAGDIYRSQPGASPARQAFQLGGWWGRKIVQPYVYTADNQLSARPPEIVQWQAATSRYGYRVDPSHIVQLQWVPGPLALELARKPEEADSRFREKAQEYIDTQTRDAYGGGLAAGLGMRRLTERFVGWEFFVEGRWVRLSYHQ